MTTIPHSQRYLHDLLTKFYACKFKETNESLLKTFESNPYVCITMEFTNTTKTVTSICYIG